MEAVLSDMNQETLEASSSFEKVVPMETRRGDGRNHDQRRRTNHGMTKRVFISYSRDDQPMVQQLSDDLRAVGHCVFIDTELSGGQAWWSQLLGKIRDCDVYMPILSSKWLASRPCGLESDYAAKLSRPFLPVQLGDVSPRLFRPEIAETQWVPYQPSDKSAALRLVGALAVLPDAPPLPNELPLPPDVPIAYLNKLRDKVLVSHDLTRQEQELLLAEFRRRASNSDDHDELLLLLRQFRSRDDLNVHVAADIERLIARIGAEAEASQTPFYTSSPSKSQPPPPKHDSAEPAVSNTATGKILAAYVLAVISILFAPIVFGPTAIVLAVKAKKEGDSRARVAFVVAILAMTIGMIFGLVLVAQNF